MDLEQLRTVQTRERATDGLQELRDSFYEDVAAYIESLRERRREAADEADDPFRSPEVNDLTDEIETAEQVAEAIYERRIGKLLKQASLAAAGMPDDQDGLTAEEQDLYESLVEHIEANKREVLETVAGKRDPGTSDETEAVPGANPEPAEMSGTNAGPGKAGTAPATPDREAEASGKTAEERVPDEAGDDRDEGDEGGDADPPEISGEEMSGPTDIDRTKVRVTEDVGEIFGVDERSYHLQSGVVVDLPRENADPLLERDAAERME